MRFIPTLVGNTALSDNKRLYDMVHPHTRGEHAADHTLQRWIIGSSPHSWGTRGLIADPFVGGRFIPTLVGNTSTK